jgi:CBS domain-containing protein
MSALFAGLTTGLWWLILGWFIFAMARGYRSEAQARGLLSGARVSDLMTPDPVTAPADMTVEDFVESLLARHPHDIIPVISDAEVIGVAGFKQVREIPRPVWRETTLAQVAVPISEVVVAEAPEPIETALDRMRQAQSSRAVVLNSGRLVGMLTLSDLASHLRFRSEMAELARAS